jgi:hypothetical protein
MTRTNNKVVGGLKVEAKKQGDTDVIDATLNIATKRQKMPSHEAYDLVKRT